MRQDVQVVQAMVDMMVGIPRFSYPARQNNAPKPKGNFAHIRLIEEYPVGLPTNYIMAQDDGTTTYRSFSPARLRFRIGIRDTDGVPSSKVMHGWTSEPMRQLMAKTGYGFIRCDPLSNEDKKLEKEWEPRVGFSLELYATRQYDQVVDNITGMEISGKFYDAIESIDLDININKE